MIHKLSNDIFVYILYYCDMITLNTLQIISKKIQKIIFTLPYKKLCLLPTTSLLCKQLSYKFIKKLTIRIDNTYPYYTRNIYKLLNNIKLNILCILTKYNISYFLNDLSILPNLTIITNETMQCIIINKKFIILKNNNNEIILTNISKCEHGIQINGEILLKCAYLDYNEFFRIFNKLNYIEKHISTNTKYIIYSYRRTYENIMELLYEDGYHVDPDACTFDSYKYLLC
jgi:hypothetical protein